MTGAFVATSYVRCPRKKVRIADRFLSAGRIWLVAEQPGWDPGVEGLSLGTYVAWMSSYYGRAWDAWAMEEVSEDGGPQSGSFSFGESLGKASTGWRSSPEQQAPSGRAHGDEGGADWYDIASNASSEGSWWKGDSWSWYSWDGGSDRSRSNWVYVARSGGDGWKRDGWHQWHGSRGGRDGRELHSGLCQESAECREDPGAPSERSGESEGEGGNVGRLPSGKVVSVQERADKDEEKKTQGKVTSSYPPVFRARQGESYREWKRAVKFWLKGEGQQLPYHLVGPRVMVQLRERAGQLVKHLEPEDVDDKQGLEKIFAVLEKSPLIRQSEKHRVDWHRKRLLTLTRLPGESLESYITRASLYRDQLQGLDAGLAMGERFFVGHLLDHARITKRDKAMIKTHAVKETEIAITEAMMELAAELEGEAGCPIGQSESQVSGANGEEHMVQRGVVGFRFGKKEVKPALAVDGADDVGTEMAYSLDGIAEEGPGNDSCDEPDLPADVLHAEHEALALQFKAKQKMAEVRKMRNYYRKNDGDGRKGGGRGAARCFVCDEVGHLARDCPRAKAVNPSPVLMTTTANEETSAAAEWELLASLCRSPADASSVKEVYMVLSPQLGGEDNNTTFKMIQPHDTWWNLKELSRKVILDLGCMRNVVGLQWANDVIQSWKQKGRWLRVLEEEETFRFGDGNTLKSKYRLQMEATFGGRKVLLAFSVVPGPCPPLLSKQSHSMLGVQIDTANNTLSSKKLKISRYGLTETEAGHYAMSIDEFHVLKNDDETWKQNPPQMGIGEEVALFHVETADKEAFGSTHLGEQDQLLDGHFRSPVQPAGMSTLRQLESPDSSLSGDVGWQLRDDLPGECQSQGVVGGGEVAAGRGARSESQASTSQHGGGEKGNYTTAKQSSSLRRGASCGREMIQKRRTKLAASAKKRIENKALTGIQADYPSLSNCWSEDLTFNILRSTQSRLVTFMWKKLVWQLRVREAINVESKGKAKWKPNPRWQAYLLSFEVAALWGHLGTVRQRLRSSDFHRWRRWGLNEVSTRRSRRPWRTSVSDNYKCWRWVGRRSTSFSWRRSQDALDWPRWQKIEKVGRHSTLWISSMVMIWEKSRSSGGSWTCWRSMSQTWSLWAPGVGLGVSFSASIRTLTRWWRIENKIFPFGDFGGGFGMSKPNKAAWL